MTIGVMSVLLALLLPAVQSARESARRIQCANNLRQIMLATEGFAASRGEYPEYGWAGFDDQGRPWNRTSVPHVEILPYLDQAPIFNRIDRDDFYGVFSAYDVPRARSSVNDKLMKTTIPLFQCPSDRRVQGGCNYRVNLGTGANYDTSPPTDAFAACFDPNNGSGAFLSHRALGPRDFTDGLSQTAFYCERVIGSGNVNRYDPWRDYSPITDDWPHCTADALRYTCRQVAGISTIHAPFAGYTWFFPSKGQTAYDHILSPNSQTPDCSYDDPASPESWNAAMAARSQHLGIVNAAFGDGSVHGISESIDVRVWRAMGTRAKQD